LNPSDIRALGCFPRKDRAPETTFGLFPLGRVGGRVAEAHAHRAGGRPFCFFARAGRVGVEILSSKTGWAWAGARTRPALSEVLSVGNFSSGASSTGLTADMAALGGNAMENFRGRIMEFEVLLQAAQTEVRLRDQFIQAKGLAEEYASWSKMSAPTLPYTSSSDSSSEGPEV